MAKLKKAIMHRRIERPYTRISKFRKKAFVRNRPHSVIVKFTMGDSKKDYPIVFDLVSKENFQIRHNALEAARQTSNRLLEKSIGKNLYCLKINVFPHHIVRENPLAAGAGADRMSTGMARSFGKLVGSVAQVKKGQPILTISVPKGHVDTAKLALKRACAKFAYGHQIVRVK